MTAAPYYYYGHKDFAAQVYEEVKDADYDVYREVRKKYKVAFLNSRPYAHTRNARGECKFNAEWGRTLKLLRELYGYTAPTKAPNTWSALLREEGH
jgi:hypothetical protein